MSGAGIASKSKSEVELPRSGRATPDIEAVPRPIRAAKAGHYRLSADVAPITSSSKPAVQQTGNPKLFDGYAPHSASWDELFDRAGQPHPHCAALLDRLGRLAAPEFQARRASADLAFINQGIAF